MYSPPRTKEVSLTVASRLLGLSLARTSRIAATGRLGPVRRGTLHVFVPVEGIENHLGTKLTDERIAAARNPNAPRDPLWPGPVRVTIPKKITYSFDQW